MRLCNGKQLDLFDGGAQDEAGEPLGILGRILSVPLEPQRCIAPEDVRFCQDLEAQKSQALKLLKKVRDIFRYSGLKNELFNVERPLSDIDQNIERIKQRFRNEIKQYLERKYKVTLDLSTLDDSDPSYREIIDCIIGQLNGMTFDERAEQEIKDQCKQALGEYTIRYASLSGKRLTMDAVAFDEGYTGGITLSYRTRERLYPFFKALCLFDSGEREIYTYFSRLLSNESRPAEFWLKKHDLSFMEKLESVRFYKNRRMDLVFTSCENATVFAVEYCGYQPKA